MSGDLHAVGQHFALSSAHFERIGKIRFGLDPGPGPSWRDAAERLSPPPMRRGCRRRAR